MSDPPERGARERILAAAVDRIATDGIDDMRIARVATQAGVSTSLVHYHFETREALLAEALEYSYELTGDVRIGEGEGEASDHFERLAGVIDQFLPYPGHLREGLDPVRRAVAARRAPSGDAPDRRAPLRAHARLGRGGDRGGHQRRRVQGRRGPRSAMADRLIALADGYGVRVLIGDLDIEHARREVWAGLADELGLPEEPPPPLGAARAGAGTQP